MSTSELPSETLVGAVCVSLILVDGKRERRQQAPSGSVLLVTSDEEIQNEVRRLAASASVPVEVVPEAPGALSAWQAASVVLVGGDCAGPMARLRPSRRRCVSVVNVGAAHLDVFRSAMDIGAVQVVELPTTQDWLAEVLADSSLAEPGRGSVVGIISAAGGVGGTSLAAATATLGAERSSTVLVDLDPVGVGIERVLGYQGDSVTRWATLGTRALSPHGLREALPRHENVHLVGFGRSSPRLIEPSSAASVLSACTRAFDLTVVDVPRSLAPAAREALQRCDLAVVLCPQNVTSTIAGQRLVASLERSSRVALVTRAGSRHVDADEIAQALGVPLLVDVGDQRGLDEALAAGVGPLRSRGSGLRKAAMAVLDQLKVTA